MRKLYKFWLNLADDTEYTIAEICEYAKSKREYARLIRDGIRLLWDLRQGNTTVLSELFPWVLNQPNRAGVETEQFISIMRQAARPVPPVESVNAAPAIDASTTFMDQMLGI